jgi:hypothetical protein
MSSASDLGRFIGKLSNEQSVIKDNMSGDEEIRILELEDSDEIIFDENATATALFFEDNALVFDHPIYSDLNVYIWDAGYEGTEIMWII